MKFPLEEILLYYNEFSYTIMNFPLEEILLYYNEFSYIIRDPYTIMNSLIL